MFATMHWAKRISVGGHLAKWMEIFHTGCDLAYFWHTEAQWNSKISKATQTLQYISLGDGYTPKIGRISSAWKILTVQQTFQTKLKHTFEKKILMTGRIKDLIKTWNTAHSCKQWVKMQQLRRVCQEIWQPRNAGTSVRWRRSLVAEKGLVQSGQNHDQLATSMLEPWARQFSRNDS